MIPRPKFDDQQTSTRWLYGGKRNVQISLIAQEKYSLVFSPWAYLQKGVWQEEKKKEVESEFYVRF